MRKLIGLLIASGIAFAGAARADVVTETVALQSNGTACPNGAGYEVSQEVQDPDGGTSLAPSSYVVPQGYALEVTDVDARHNLTGVYAEWLYVAVQNRYNPARSYVGFAAELLATPITKADANLHLQWGDEYIIQRGSQHYALSTGFLVRPAARLCVNVHDNVLSGRVQLRGRLHASPTPIGIVGNAPAATH